MLQISSEVIRQLVGDDVYKTYLSAVTNHTESFERAKEVLEGDDKFEKPVLLSDGTVKASRVAVEVSEEFCAEVLSALAKSLEGDACYTHLDNFYPTSSTDTEVKVRSALTVLRKKKCVKPLGGDRWMLTKYGRSQASGHGETTTSKFLTENYDNIRKDCESLVSRKFRKSQRMGLVEDHVQAFFVKMLEKDTIAKRKEGGKGVPSSTNMAWWCSNHVTTEIRGWGRDASLQSSRGALTERGYEKRKAQDLTEVPFLDSYTSPVLDELSLMEDTQVTSPEDEVYISNALSVIDDEIKRLIPGASDRYRNIAHMLFVEDMKVGEIAQAEGVSMARASTMCSILSKRLRSSRKVRVLLNQDSRISRA